MRAGHNFRLIGNQGRHLVEIEAAIHPAFYKLEGRSGSAADHLPGQQIAVVLHDGHQHFVPGAHAGKSIAVSHQIQSLCGVSGEDDLAGAFGIQKGPDGLAGVFISDRSYISEFLPCQ